MHHLQNDELGENGFHVVVLVHTDWWELIVFAQFCVQWHHVGSLKLSTCLFKNPAGEYLHHGNWQMLRIRGLSIYLLLSRLLNTYHNLRGLPVLTDSESIILIQQINFKGQRALSLSETPVPPSLILLFCFHRSLSRHLHLCFLQPCLSDFFLFISDVSGERNLCYEETMLWDLETNIFALITHQTFVFLIVKWDWCVSKSKYLKNKSISFHYYTYNWFLLKYNSESLLVPSVFLLIKNCF